MTENAWIAIAQIIAGFIFALWQVRATRATANPAQNQPTHITKERGTLKYRIVTFAGWLLQLGALAWAVFNFVAAARRPGDFNKEWVFNLVMFSMGLAFQASLVICFFVVSLTMWHRDKVLDAAFDSSQLAVKAADTSMEASSEAMKAVSLLLRTPLPPEKSKRQSKRRKP